MSGGGMQAQQGVGTAASGGKGGQMGGPQLNGMSQAGTGPQRPMIQPTSGYGPGQSEDGPGMTGGGGKGGNNDKYLPDESGGMRKEMPTDPVSQGPTAFDQGLGAMNQGMDWMQGAMGHQAPTLGGSYGISAPQAQAAMMSAPGRELYDYNAAQAQGQSYNAAQLSDKDIGDYMNPYTQNVIDSSMNDLNKARQQAMNSTGAAATQGGAFGGDRHGIMEAQNNADYMDQVARTSSQLRNQGYQNAQNAAMGDVNSLNQSYASNAGMAQQAGLANQAANNARSQFVGGTANSNAMQTAANNQSAQNQMNALNAQQQMAASQFNAGMDFNKDQFNAGQDQQSFMNQMAGAQNLYGMGNDRWNMGQDQVDKMAGVGNQVDQLNQGYINSVMNMFQNQQNAPQAQYQQMLAAMSGQPNWGGTQSYNPGVFDYASLAAGTAGSVLGGK